jgi:NAD(P)-dependent dehydrogenase (short-subunit alcohol dehydrogenase family)
MQLQKTVYITGADRGLGFALTKKFLEAGYFTFAGRYLEEWNWLAELQTEYPENLKLVDLDLDSDSSIKKAAAEIAKNTDSLDLLINNAGIFAPDVDDILGELDFEIMEKMYRVNSLGPLKVTHSVIELLLKGEKKLLINISSEAGSIADCPRKKEYGYSMSKTAVNMQSKIIQNHLQEKGLKVFALHPGYLKTYMLGDKNEEADIEAAESAAEIFRRFVEARKDYQEIYYDYQGNQLSW